MQTNQQLTFQQCFGKYIENTQQNWSTMSDSDQLSSLDYLESTLLSHQTSSAPDSFFSSQSSVDTIIASVADNHTKKFPLLKQYYQQILHKCRVQMVCEVQPEIFTQLFRLTNEELQLVPKLCEKFKPNVGVNLKEKVFNFNRASIDDCAELWEVVEQIIKQRKQ